MEEDEYVMVCEPYTKLKAIGPPDQQPRLYIMTTHRIYTFKSQLKSRQYNIKDVGAIIQSTMNETDCMIFFERAEDLVIRVNGRQALLDLLKLRFNCMNRDVTLRVFGVTNQQLLIHYRNNVTTGQNKRKDVIDLPDDNQRLVKEEIKGEQEYLQELKR